MIGFSEDPAAPYRARLDKASFFAWVQGQEGGRYELKDGEIVMHAGSTRRHSWLAQEFAFLLSPTELKGGAAAIEITSLGISLPLADLYRGIVDTTTK